MSRGALPKGGDDDVQTDDGLALAVVRHFLTPERMAEGPLSVLEPCAGEGAFVRALHAHGIENVTAFEIKQGLDFLTAKPPAKKFDWLITNEPWSLMLDFLNQAMRFAKNVVFVDKLNAWTITARLRAMERRGYAFKEAALINQPPAPWPQMGLQFAAVHIGPTVAPGDLGQPILSRINWYPIPPKCQACRGEGWGPDDNACPECDGYGRILPGRERKKTMIQNRFILDGRDNRQKAMLEVLTRDDAVGEIEFEGRPLLEFPTGFLPVTNMCLYCSLKGRNCWDLPFRCSADARPDGLNIVFASPQITEP